MNVWEEILKLRRRRRANRDQVLEAHREWEAKHYWPALRELQALCTHKWHKKYPPFGPSEPYLECEICDLSKDE